MNYPTRFRDCGQNSKLKTKEWEGEQRAHLITQRKTAGTLGKCEL